MKSFDMVFTGAWAVWLLILLACKGSHEAECEVKSSADRVLNMNLNGKRNETGQWVSTFTAKKKTSMNSSSIEVDATLKVSECQEKQMILIKGVLREPSSFHKTDEEKLLFHPNCGANVLIVNKGRSIAKRQEAVAEYGVAITNRPLKDDEVFEVRLDKKTSKFSYGIGIGVTTHDPETLEVPQNMYSLRTGTWVFYDRNLFMNGTLIKKNYVRDLGSQEVGDRLGIKKTESGVLHLYFNGVDQGPAVTRVPNSIYGFYELQGNAVAATIVDASYS